MRTFSGPFDWFASQNYLKLQK
ncbi:hypothetical protein [Escherichia coli]|nr:hypothetical protein [Escherichia coli]